MIVEEDDKLPGGMRGSAGSEEQGKEMIENLDWKWRQWRREMKGEKMGMRAGIEMW